MYSTVTGQKDDYLVTSKKEDSETTDTCIIIREKLKNKMFSEVSRI